MANTPASQRRGSGVSITLNPTKSVAGVVDPPQHANGMAMTGGSVPNMYPAPGYGPYMIHTPSYPLLMNPPPMPTVSNNLTNKSSSFTVLYKLLKLVKCAN